MSGGQRQRLAIARSIVRQPTILVLDEATSSIDVRGEKVVQAALNRVSRDRTTIMIAHRLSTVRRAENIVVIQDGANVEQGTHQELMARGDVYKNLVNAQKLEPLEDFIEKEVEDILVSHKEDIRPHEYSSDASGGEEKEPQTTRKDRSRGLIRSLGTVLYEHRKHWIIYVLTVTSAVGAGCGYAPPTIQISKAKSLPQLDMHCKVGFLPSSFKCFNLLARN